MQKGDRQPYCPPIGKKKGAEAPRRPASAARAPTRPTPDQPPSRRQDERRPQRQPSATPDARTPPPSHENQRTPRPPSQRTSDETDGPTTTDSRTPTPDPPRDGSQRHNDRDRSRNQPKKKNEARAEPPTTTRPIYPSSLLCLSPVREPREERSSESFMSHLNTLYVAMPETRTGQGPRAVTDLRKKAR